LASDFLYFKMARSLRSYRSKVNKTALRKKVHGPNEQARAERIHQRLVEQTEEASIPTSTSNEEQVTEPEKQDQVQMSEDQDRVQISQGQDQVQISEEHNSDQNECTKPRREPTPVEAVINKDIGLPSPPGSPRASASVGLEHFGFRATGVQVDPISLAFRSKYPKLERERDGPSELLIEALGFAGMGVDLGGRGLVLSSGQLFLG
jgi:hypothetical protein